MHSTSHFHLKRPVYTSYRLWLQVFFSLCLYLLIAQPSQAALPKAATFTPPNLHAPTEVDLYFYIENISNINLNLGTFDVTAGMVFKWHDPRLAFDPADNFGQKQQLIAGPYATTYLEKIWHPWFEVSGEQGLHVGTVQSLSISANGDVEVWHKFSTSSQFINELVNYPFGSLTLRLAITPVLADAQQMKLIPKTISPDNMAELDEVLHGNWEPVAIKASLVEVERDDLPGSTHEQLEILITVEHDFIDGLHKIFLPLLVVALASFALLWLNLIAQPAYSSPRISGFITLILTVIALKFALRGELPVVHYGTLTDGFYNITIVMLSIGLICSCVVAAYVTAARPDIAYKVHTKVRVIYPAVYIVAIIINVLFFSLQ